MRVAFVIYDGLTTLDFAGVYDPVTRLKSMGFVEDLTCDVCAKSETVRTAEGLVLLAGSVDPDLSAYDYVVVPGGEGVRDLVRDRDFLSWIAVGSDTTRIAAVCGGVLLAGAAGMLRGRRATTHPGMQEFLKLFAAEVVSDRIVEDGNVITAGGVTAAIDLGLYLCEKIAGPGVREKIQKQMDYRNYATK